MIGTASNYPTHLKHGQFRSVSTRTFVQRRPTLKYLEGILYVLSHFIHYITSLSEQGDAEILADQLTLRDR